MLHKITPVTFNGGNMAPKQQQQQQQKHEPVSVLGSAIS